MWPLTQRSRCTYWNILALNLPSPERSCSCQDFSSWLAWWWWGRSSWFSLLSAHRDFPLETTIIIHWKLPNLGAIVLDNNSHCHWRKKHQALFLHWSVLKLKLWPAIGTETVALNQQWQHKHCITRHSFYLHKQKKKSMRWKRTSFDPFQKLFLCGPTDKIPGFSLDLTLPSLILNTTFREQTFCIETLLNMILWDKCSRVKKASQSTVGDGGIKKVFAHKACVFDACSSLVSSFSSL